MSNELRELVSMDADEAELRLERLEASLRQRERELAEAQRIARLGTFHWDFVQDKVTWSSEVFLTYGIDPEQEPPRGESSRKLHTPESWSRLIAAIEHTRATGEPYVLDLQMLPPDGSLRWVAIRGEVAASGADGKVEAIRGTVQNITERKLAELELAERERELREAQRIGRLGTWRWIAATDEVQWSEEVYLAFGLDPKLPPPGFEALRTMHAPESAARLASLVERAMATGESYAHDMELVPADGSRRWILSRGEVGARTADGRVAELRGTIQDITERKQMELAQTETQSRFQKLYNSDLIGICYPDRHGAFYDGNDEFLRIVGYSREELEAGEVRWDRMTPPEWVAADVAHIAEAAERGSCTPYEKEYLRKDGTRVSIFCGYALLEGSKDNYIAFITDLTAQKAAERAQRESQARFQKLYDSDLIGVGFPSADGSIPEGNDALLRITGYTRKDMQAGLVRWDTMTPPEYRDLDLQHIREAAEFGRCTPYEKEYIRKDGSRVPILCGFARLGKDEPGSIGFVMDLSAQKAAEQAARKREVQFQELAESLPQLVWTVDTDGSRVYANRRYTDYTGITEARELGRIWRELLHPDDLPKTNRLWTRCMETGEPFLDEYRIRRHDGVYRSFLVRAVPVHNAEGGIERWLGSATDVHEQKLAEEALRRTEKLAAAGRLAATIAHEINNPLAAVTNSLYLALMDEGLSETTRSYLNMAEQELARAAHVTTQTLQFHRQTSAPAVVSLGVVMDSAMALFETRFRTCQIVAQREYGKQTELFCCGDELRQVFANLLSNALDAMRQGGRLRVRIRRGHSWGEARVEGIRVTVADTGLGIPMEVRPRIFEPFLSTKEATGTGLGLWVSQNIVQKHKGRIQLYSRAEGERRGTVFSVFLPLEGLPGRE